MQPNSFSLHKLSNRLLGIENPHPLISGCSLYENKVDEIINLLIFETPRCCIDLSLIIQFFHHPPFWVSCSRYNISRKSLQASFFYYLHKGSLVPSTMGQVSKEMSLRKILFPQKSLCLKSNPVYLQNRITFFVKKNGEILLMYF